MDSESTDSPSDYFDEYRDLDMSITSQARDGATVTINGTELLLTQYSQVTPMMVELYVENESNPLGVINTARGDTVTLGGVDEGLAKRLDEIRKMPVEEMLDALEQLAYRLNPAGREPPTDKTETEDEE